MFEQRQRSMQAALGAWARHSLTMLGRIHVAKQVVASKWYYHATFVPPPEAAAKAMQQQISRFVQHGAVLEGASAGATLHGRPAAAITALPAEDGGLGAPDLQMQVAALHARVAVRFLHPAASRGRCCCTQRSAPCGPASAQHCWCAAPSWRAAAR